MKSYLLLLLCLSLLSCKNKTDDSIEKLKLSEVEIKKNIFDFGSINIGDTVNHSFIITNISERKFIIDTVGTSCGCTMTSFTKDSVERYHSAKINVTFIAEKNSSGKISKSIVVSDNSSKGFHTFYLKGKVK
ncbi:DUF1573 domain-containing protein [Flavobacterium fluviatile]|uniref:DUF1573 domain-containing protein n=1 Tax=Flavobacterium fluviatile TaxID=1862387 RepID=UPI0013CF50E2|nr:DUF1573 domain-containing protein [Flavobacterium fluviatile]